jgi:hypothetical protein
MQLVLNFKIVFSVQFEFETPDLYILLCLILCLLQNVEFAAY